MNNREEEKMNSKMKKLVFSVMGILLLSFMFMGSFNVYAAENENVAEYDMAQGGTQQFTILDDDNEEITIVVEEYPSLNRVANGTYKISSEKANSWRASYDIVVSSNLITQAKNPSATAITGSFITKSLKHESSKQATYYLTKKNGLLVNNLQVRSTINGTSIVITN